MRNSNHITTRNNDKRSVSVTAVSIPVVAIVLVLFVMIFPPASQASETVLSDINISSKDDKTIIDIDLGLPLGYVKHFPQTFGEILQIQLLLDKGGDRRIHKEVRQGSDLKPPPGIEPILIYVTYEEGVPGGPYLTLRFDHPVRFEVLAGSSLTTLTIAVFEKQKTASQEDAEQIIAPVKGISADEMKKTEAKPDDELMAKARQSLTFGDNTGSIELLRKVIATPESQHAQDARELLGLALERSNQIPRAKFEYKKYLKLYKEGSGPNRVKQRLTALQNIGLDKRKKLRVSKRSSDQDNYRVFGRWSQAFSTRFLQRQAKDADDRVGAEDLVLTRLATTNVNIRGRYRGEERNIQTVFTGNHTYDVLGDNKRSTFNNEVENDTEGRITELYVDYDEFKKGLTATVGRQNARDSGVFGRFDGVIGGYQILPEVKAYAYAGKPVSFFNIDFDKSFIGARVDVGKRKSPLNGNLYYVQQEIDGIDDRQAFGGGVRYSDKETTLFGIADYDILFGKLTLVNIRWGWKYIENSKLNISYNRRNLLFTSTAINGQKILSISDLLEIPSITEEDLREMAVARTSDSQTITIGNSYNFDKDRQLDVDLNVFDSGGTQEKKFTPQQIADANAIYPDYTITGDALNEITPLPGTGNQYSLSMQYISSNTFKEQDLYVLGLRYSDYTHYDEISVFINARMPPINGWKMQPRLAIGHRKFSETSLSAGTRLSVFPSLKVDYRWKKKWVFDVEVGADFVKYSNANVNDETRQNLRVGYHYTF